MNIPTRWEWFPEARFGLFIHWGPYSEWGRGEQVLFREHIDQRAYAEKACAWAPRFFDARRLVESARLGDLETLEHHIIPEADRLWESCQVSTWRL